MFAEIGADGKSSDGGMKVPSSKLQIPRKSGLEFEHDLGLGTWDLELSFSFPLDLRKDLG